MALAAEKELEHIGETCVDRGFNPRTEVTLPSPRNTHNRLKKL